MGSLRAPDVGRSRRASVGRRMSSVVQAMRRTRRVRRLGELEWFDVAYRVYLAALVGGGVILWLSGLVTDEPATAEQIADVLAHGPAVLGMAVAVAVALGLRSGSDGGPVALEAPTSATCCWHRCPGAACWSSRCVQRLRTMALGGALRRRRRRAAGGAPAARIGSGVGRQRRAWPARRRAPRSSPSPC